MYILSESVENTGWRQLFPIPTGTDIMQVVTVNANAPTAGVGANGDIWFQTTETGVNVFQKSTGTWTNKGALPSGGTKTIINVAASTPDPYVISWTTSLRNKHGDAPSLSAMIRIGTTNNYRGTTIAPKFVYDGTGVLTSIEVELSGSESKITII